MQYLKMEVNLQKAPILIATLCRYDHFKNTINSLKLCTGAVDTDLFIALDFPLHETHFEGYILILSFLDNITGFKSINIIKRLSNYGAERNFNDAKNIIFEKYDSIIILEDDNIFAPNFIDYMNGGLQKFYHNSYVFGVCGYQYPIDTNTISGTYYLNSCMSGWGFGIWRHKLMRNIIPVSTIVEALISIKNAQKLYKSNLLGKCLRHIFKKKPLYGDMALDFQLVLSSDLKCIFPVVSKVRNIGHDGTGIHNSRSSNIYHEQKIDSNINFEFIKVNKQDCKKIIKSVDNYFKPNLVKLLKIIIVYLYWRLFNTIINK